MPSVTWPLAAVAAYAWAMRAEPSSPPVEFPAFCAAVRAWLRECACLDPALAAVADLVEDRELDEAALRRSVAAAADTHAVLGASALISLWSGLPG